MGHRRTAIILCLAAALILLVLGAFNILSPLVVLALAAAVALYFFTGSDMALLLALVPLLLVPGQFIRLEIRPNWFYEMSLAEIALLLAFLLFAIGIAVKDWKKPLRFGPTGLLLTVYFLLALASFFWISDVQLYVASLKVLVFSLIAFVLAYNFFDTDKRLAALMYALAVFVGLLSLQIFYTLYKMGFLSALLADRSSILVPYGPLALVAAMLALLLPLLLGYYFYLPAKRRGRLLFIIAFLIGGMALFMSLGKAAVLSVIIGLGYLFYKLRGHRVILGLSFLFCIMCALVALSPFVNGFQQRLSNIFVDGTTTFRVAEYYAGYRIVSSSPWIGVGLGEQLNLYRRLLHPDYGELSNNYLMQATMDLGLLGLLIYSALLISLIRSLLRLNRQAPDPFTWGLTASAIVVSINGLLEVTVFAVQYAIVLWLLLGVVQARLHSVGKRL